MERTAAGRAKAERQAQVEILDEQQQAAVVDSLRQRIDSSNVALNRIAGVLFAVGALYFVYLYFSRTLPDLPPLTHEIAMILLLPSLVGCSFLSFNPTAIPFPCHHLEFGGPALLLTLLAATSPRLSGFGKLVWSLPAVLVGIGYEARSESDKLQRELGNLLAKMYQSPSA